MKKYKAFLSRCKNNFSLIIGFSILLTIVCAVIFVPMIWQIDTRAIHYEEILQPPSSNHIMGTDNFGRDLFARLIEGGRVSLNIGFQVMIGTSILGVIIALLAGYYEMFDIIIMRFMDIMMAFPSLLLAIALLAIFQNSTIGVSVALGIVYLPRTVRIVRSSVLTIREEAYIEAAHSIGTKNHVILLKHILPGVLPVLIVQETFLFAYAILAEAGISFVGVGVQPPNPSWGNILSDATALLREAPWMVIYPGLCIMLSVLALNLIGDGLREVIDPKRQKGTAQN